MLCFQRFIPSFRGPSVAREPGIPTHDGGYRFRVRRFTAPRNDTRVDQASQTQHQRLRGKTIAYLDCDQINSQKSAHRAGQVAFSLDDLALLWRLVVPRSAVSLLGFLEFAKDRFGPDCWVLEC